MRLSSLLLLLFTSLPSSLSLTYKAADFTSLPLIESSGHTYSDNGSTKPFETILASHGCNTARIRLWTSGQYQLSYGLALARRVKAAGMTLVVDLHFSDTWADPGHQAIPSGWPTTLDGLNTQVFTYTQSIVQAFAAQGTPIDILQVGNEINDGFLWPVGQISINGFSGASQMLNSAINGAKQAGSSIPIPKIMLHLADGWSWSEQSFFYSSIFIPGELSTSDLDILGVSFYPFYNTAATLAALKSSLTNLAGLMGKPIVVAETDWPVSCEGVSLSETGIAISMAGQDTWIEDVEGVVAGLPNGLGQGIFYWEPGWIGNAALGSGCSDNLLVSSTGATRASIDIFTHM
ncbi:arabinogalactan endo-1,4-beta-galactosidase [Stereum hirsutum FP-91666 SS1]|uniref:arabinogalactan endo-1,4-beta-galactosidase n=1 Tax=Stereum hirsutum (strain FP-91666) TaxID=721885 RepID=UPI0004409EFF|nr:arabinogalactan endo-1,4-beta-galactosidase [Stereum hirsutum FP-91666 SS1]EIM87864.1 arabinogalactan endo-1,4-beta-galactosidase [Stereum hirsutum FP-91666 SS1]